MKNIIIFIFFLPVLAYTQTDNKIEGIIINAPCELEYTRNLGNQNNYSCVIQDSNEFIFNYSATVQNLFEEMNGLNGNQLETFKKTFLETAKNNAETNNETAEYISLSNNIKALKIKSKLFYSNQNFVNISIVFLYKQKSFVVNMTTNDLKLSASNDLINRIKLK
ncbi:MAG: hypothetical protein ACYCZ2_08430 [Lutibacter sp.]